MVYEREQVSVALALEADPPPLIPEVSRQYVMCAQDNETPRGNLPLHWPGLDCARPGRMAGCYSNKIAGSQVHLRSLSGRPEISQIDQTQLRSTQHHSGQTKYTDILGASI